MCFPTQPKNHLLSLALMGRLRPGQRVPDSGIYQTESGHRATLVRGEPAPPTRYSGETWCQIVETNPLRSLLG